MTATNHVSYHLANHLKTALFVGVVTALAAGCGTTREAKYDAKPTAPATEEAKGEAQSAEEQGDALWAERVQKEKLMECIVKWEMAAEKSPNFDLLVKLARAHYFLADGFYAVEGDEAKRDAHYTKGLTFAEGAIGLGAPEYVAAVKGGATHIDSVKKVPVEAAPALYWQATNLGKWAASQGFATKLKYKDDAKATMDYIMEVTPDFFYSAPYRYFGAFEAATSGLAGGSLEKSNEYFKTAVEKSPGYLGTKVLWADYYAVKTNDRALYEKLLNEVLAADVNAEAEIIPENTREQAKAKRLLTMADEQF